MAEKYDVFISFKNTAPGGGLTQDRAIAERLHAKLMYEGLNVFFSEKDLSEMAFMKQIYRALDEAELLILVGTSAEYVQSEWVESEWMNFLGAINSGRKPNGKIMTILHGMTTRDLPLELSNFQSFNANDMDAAVDYIFKSLGKVSISEARKFQEQEEERKRQEAERKELEALRKQMEAERAAQKAQEDAKRAQERAKKAEQRAQNKGKASTAIAVISAIVVLIAAGVVWWVICNVKAADFSYVENDTGVTITGYNGTKNEVIIPDSIGGKKVISIGDYAFKDCTYITSIDIPDCVINIGTGAFWGCSGLSKVKIPNSIESINEATFYYCTNLTSIEIPESVTIIDNNAFTCCASLTHITVPDNVISIGIGTFRGCDNITSITIPDSVTSIGTGAFDNCDKINITYGRGISSLEELRIPECAKSVVLPDSVTSIGDMAFWGCANLESITIPNSVTSIGDWAFEGCTSLESITIPDSVTSIERYAFSGCHITVYAPHPARYYCYWGYSSDYYGEDVTWVVQ